VDRFSTPKHSLVLVAVLVAVLIGVFATVVV